MRKLLITLLTFLGASANPIYPNNPAQIPLSTAKEDTKVDVSLYVMSRCPDARLCEGVFEEVFKTKGIWDKVDLHVDYIGQKNSSSPFKVSCKHGPLECQGNIQQLCLQHHLNSSTFYPILSCMNYKTPFPDYIGTSQLLDNCAKAVGVDLDKTGVSDCLTASKKGKKWEGRDLLIHSIEESLKEGVGKSCTIRIGEVGKRRECVVDGGVWTGCDDGHTAADFVRVIDEEWNKLHPKSI